MSQADAFNRQEVLSWFADYVDGTISPSSGAKLQDVLRESGLARILYVQFIELHVRFRDLGKEVAAADAASAFIASSRLEPAINESPISTAHCDSSSLSDDHARPVAKTIAIDPPRAIGWFDKKSTNRSLVWSMLAASLLFAAYIVAISWNMWGRDKPRKADVASQRSDASTRSAVATIHESTGAVWANDSAAKWTEASVVAGEPLKIESGIVRMQLKQGTILTIESPAEWRIKGENQAWLKRGKIFAHVPPQATGFTLDTPTAHIVDLGTEFGAVVAQSGETRLQVVQGKVQVAQNQTLDKPQQLAAGEAVKIDAAADGTATIQKIPFDAKQAAIKPPAKALDRWIVASQKLRTDPSLVAYYDFEPPSKAGSTDNELRNVIADKLHGQITSAKTAIPWTKGRIFGKHALALGAEFAAVTVADDAALQLNRQGTIAFWVRPDAKHWRKHSPIFAKGSLGNCSYSLWLAPDCQIRFLATDTNGKAFKCDSKLTVALDQWHQVAVTMAPGEVRLYIDGTLGRAMKSNMEFAINHEPLQIGQPAEGNGYPAFVGVVDELAIFSRVQTAEEVNAMYQAGRPK